MTSVQSHRQLLSGSKLVLILLVTVLFSCSPKVTPPVKRPDIPGELPKQEQPKPLIIQPKIGSVALILPFYTGEVNAKEVTEHNVTKAELAIAFYQGFKLALDSLAAQGFDFKLEVFDAVDNEIRIANLASAPSVINNDLIVGPVFPDAIRIFSDLAKLDDKVLVSPLAATPPQQFNNPRLVSLNNSIDQHGQKIADYINKRYQPAKVNLVVVNTQSADDLKFITPFKKQLATRPGEKFTVHEAVNSIGIEKQLIKGKTNLVLIASDEQGFVMPTINRLARLKAENGYAVDVFGHPNWVKLDIETDQLQRLNTRITSSYRVDYDALPVKNFVSRYRKEYSTEPSEYAFKGFDAGYYFGSLLAQYGKDYAAKIGTTPYLGLHNQFQFLYDAQAGFRNNSLMLLQYRGYELKPVP